MRLSLPLRISAQANGSLFPRNGQRRHVVGSPEPAEAAPRALIASDAGVCRRRAARGCAARTSTPCSGTASSGTTASSTCTGACTRTASGLRQREATSRRDERGDEKRGRSHGPLLLFRTLLASDGKPKPQRL